MKTWNFLPIYLTSLKPYDNAINKYIYQRNCCHKLKITPIEETKMETIVVLSQNYLESDVAKEMEAKNLDLSF